MQQSVVVLNTSSKCKIYNFKAKQSIIPLLSCDSVAYKTCYFCRHLDQSQLYMKHMKQIIKRIVETLKGIARKAAQTNASGVGSSGVRCIAIALRGRSHISHFLA